MYSLSHTIQQISFPGDAPIFFTSDTHFFHARIIQFANRPFSSVREMNETLVRNWNETVPKDGIVFHMGDFAFGGATHWYEMVHHLHGKKYLVLGNHDLGYSNANFLELFEQVSQQMVIAVGKQQIILNHCPMLCFGGAYRNTWQLFGHVHSGPRSLENGKDEWRMEYLFPSQYDVGVDNNDYRPVSFNQVREIIRRQTEEHMSGD